MTAQRLARMADSAPGRSSAGVAAGPECPSPASGDAAAAGPECPSPAGRSSGGRGRSLIGWRSAPQADLVAVRVGEDGEPAEVAGQVGGRDQPLAAQLLGAVQVGVEVIDPHVDLHALVLRPLAGADPSADGALPGAGVDQAVSAHGGVGSYLPAEQL